MKKSFGTLFRNQRTQANKTLIDIANLAGVTVVYISQIERGARQPPNTETVRKMISFIESEATKQQLELAAVLDRTHVEIKVNKEKPSEAEMIYTLARTSELDALDESSTQQILKILLKINKAKEER